MKTNTTYIINGKEYILTEEGLKRPGSKYATYSYEDSVKKIMSNLTKDVFIKDVKINTTYIINGKEYILTEEGLKRPGSKYATYSYEDSVNKLTWREDKDKDNDKDKKVLARDVANDVVLQRSAVCAGVAAIPGAASGLTVIECEMLMKISKIYGVDESIISPKTLISIILKYAGGIAALKAVANSISFIPGSGSIVAGSFAYVLGQTAIKFYESNFPNRVANAKMNPSEIATIEALRKLYDGKIDHNDIDNMSDFV